jgi:hypothetical protein
MMFARRTVFVVGAGASAEYGLPVGNALKGIIATNLLSEDDSSNRILHNTIDEICPDGGGSYAKAAKVIGNGLPLASSIDRYIDYHQGDKAIVDVGKVAIADSIWKAEAGSNLVLNEDGDLKFGSIQETWLAQLFLQMQEGTRRQEPKSMFENVSFVCFNYDRVIEHFMFNAVKKFSDFSDEETQVALSALRIVHPYGRIGRLPWESSAGSEAPVMFGSARSSIGGHLKMSRLIKTFSEQLSDDDGAYLDTRELINDADQLIFVGFSFLDQNMRFLTPNVACGRHVRFRATTFQESHENVNLAKDAIDRLARGLDSNVEYPFDIKMVANHEKAGDFMKNYGNSTRR